MNRHVLLRIFTALAGTCLLSGAVGHAPARADAPYAYVALGDSFSAGEGVDPYFRDGYDAKAGRQTGKKDNRCHRSTRAYAERVAPPGFSAPLYQLASKGEPGTGKRVNKYSSDANVRTNGGVSWAFLACSGARTFNVKPAKDGGTPGHADHLPQLDDPAIGGGTSLVTLTIGGNDVGFADTIGHCALHACNTKTYRAELDSRLPAVAPELDAVYSALATKAPNARIIVLGYPQLFPRSDHEQGCGKLRPWRGEQAMLRRKEAAFNALIQRKATVAGFEFIDIAKAFAGHEICGDKGEWINGPSATYKPNRKLKDDESFHPNRDGQTAVAKAVNALLTQAPPVATEITRQVPVTADARVSPGFSITETAQAGHCGEGSDIAAASYRCFSGNGVYDPCYAIAEPVTGDATSVVCPRSPFTTELFGIQAVTGLGHLDDNPFDEPHGIVLANGAKCTASQGAHDNDGAGHIVDFYCDDSKTAVLRGLRKGRTWRADIVGHDAQYKYTPAGVMAISRVVLLHHDVPPANRPVSDAGNATPADFDADARVHHEVECGTESSTASGRLEQTFTSGAPCYIATLVVVEWDNGKDLEAGWSCAYAEGDTLLCQKSASVTTDNPPAFFAATHLRAIRR